jgi:transcriptional regulator with XRE-family HTH domain/predicted GIY-YIG superfamily endonuclease
MSNGFGPRIRRMREREGLTQSALAEKLGVTAVAIHMWEGGGGINAANKKKLREILGTLSPRKDLKSDPDPDPDPDPDVETSSFGDWLRSRRMERSLTIKELAEKAGVSRLAIDNIERGKIQNPQTATRTKLAGVLGPVPGEVVVETEQESAVVGLGSLKDFQPHVQNDWPRCAGVYVLYDKTQRPVYVGKSDNISRRLQDHSIKKWFIPRIVEFGSYIEVGDKTLRHQLEQVMIKFLKSQALLNEKSTENLDESRPASVQGG